MLDVKIDTQPTDETCGSTCLHAIYRYHGLDISLSEVASTVELSLSGGTLSPLLGKHALLHGFDATIYINNMIIFDPAWFHNRESSNEVLMTKLKNQNKFKQSKSLLHVSNAFISFLKAGGKVRFKTIDVEFLKEYFEQKIPILTGLNSTYLYRISRECYTKSGEAYLDDMQGMPTGHFVVLSGYDDNERNVVVADPFRQNPFSGNNYYRVSGTRLINAIMLGVTTFDANLLIIKPK